MAAFTSEVLVREKFQSTDTSLVTVAAVAAAIDDAHTELIARLDPAYDTVPRRMVSCSGKRSSRARTCCMPWRRAMRLAQRAVTIGGQRVEGGARFAGLMAMARQAERHAWERLSPYLLDIPTQAVARVTDSQPILGENG